MANFTANSVALKYLPVSSNKVYSCRINQSLTASQKRVAGVMATLRMKLATLVRFLTEMQSLVRSMTIDFEQSKVINGLL